MRVAIVNSICVRHDAISDSVRGTQRAIRAAYGFNPTIYCYACDYRDIPHKIISRPSDLLFDDKFMRSDVVIYHFGIHYDLFDSIYLNTHARRVVYYHNVTPAEFLPPTQQGVIKSSIRQKANLAAADAIWAASRFNRDDLIDYGLPGDRISVEPLFLKFERRSMNETPVRGGPVEILFVGRFVSSKGLVDLIEAVARIRRSGAPPFRLRLAGNVDFSDREFLAQLGRRVTELGLDDCVVFEGRVSDARLAQLYARADLFALPSYHEGFCVPLIEALAAGCVPVTYDAGNLADLVGPWGITVPTGDQAAFSTALAAMIDQFAAGRPAVLDLAGRRRSWADYRAGVEAYLGTFSFEAFAERIVAGLERVVSSPEAARGV